jgi:transposase-like protein
MRREIRRALRQIELSEQCPKCEIDAETIGEEFYWNGAKRHLKCPDCGYEFQIQFRTTGNILQTKVISPEETRTIDLELTDDEREYIRRELGKLKPA